MADHWQDIGNKHRSDLNGLQNAKFVFRRKLRDVGFLVRKIIKFFGNSLKYSGGCSYIASTILINKK